MKIILKRLYTNVCYTTNNVGTIGAKLQKMKINNEKDLRIGIKMNRGKQETTIILKSETMLE